MGRSFHFTFKSDKKVGFTDNLHQLRAVYKLAVSVGGQYTHTPLRSNRSAAGIFAFLGLDDGWAHRIEDQEFADLSEYRVKFNPASYYDQSINKLQEHLLDQVNRAETSNQKKLIIVFSEGGIHSLFSVINSRLSDEEFGIDFLKRYQKARESDPMPEMISPEKSRVVFHIRQGDTAVIETPQQTYVPVFWREALRFSELHSLEELDYPYLEPRQFYDFAVKFCSALKADSYKLQIFSDGYQLAFETALKKGNRQNQENDKACRNKLNWSLVKILEDVRGQYDVKKFKPFTGLANTTCIVGEGRAKLLQFMDAILNADILVIGPQQRMVQKILALYHEPDKPKLIIVLNPGVKRPDHFVDLGLSEDYVQSIQTSVKKVDQECISSLIFRATDSLNIPLKPKQESN